MKEIPVVFEDDEILVVNKPSGIAVQGGKDIRNPLDKILPEILGRPVFLVHRLDKETSGLMIVAKSPSAAKKWTNLIGGKLVEKEYTAVCVGHFTKTQGTISENIIQHGNEKSALTRFKVISEKEFDFPEKTGNGENLKEDAEGKAEEKTVLSKVSLRLETGRMHQIRIHLSKEGNPVAGDDRHGNFMINRILKKNLGIKSLMLCATRLVIPADGKPLEIRIDVPESWNFF